MQKRLRFAFTNHAAGLDHVAAVCDGQALAGVLLYKQHTDAEFSNSAEGTEQLATHEW